MWVSDAEISHEDEAYAVETSLSCPDCKTYYLIYLPKPDNVEE